LVEGRVAFTAAGVTSELEPGRRLYLDCGQPHFVVGIDDASPLVTIILLGDEYAGHSLTG
jgi:hypothetical protein